MSNSERSSEMLNIGYGNHLARERIVAVLNPDSAPMRRFRELARSRDQLIDATQGRKTRSMVFLDTGLVILSGLHPETIVQRMTDPISEKNRSS